MNKPVFALLTALTAAMALQQQADTKEFDLLTQCKRQSKVELAEQRRTLLTLIQTVRNLFGDPNLKPDDVRTCVVLNHCDHQAQVDCITQGPDRAILPPRSTCYSQKELGTLDDALFGQDELGNKKTPLERCMDLNDYTSSVTAKLNAAQAAFDADLKAAQEKLDAASRPKQ